MAEPVQQEEQKYWDLWVRCRDPKAGDALVKKYMPLVSYHVQRIAAGLPRNVSKDDLKSLGMFGLLDSLNKFDPSRELKFDTYASFRIRGAILDGLRKEDWLSRGTREKAKKIESTIEKLEQKYMRPVSPKEIASELGMKEEEVYTTMNEQFFANVLSIEEIGTDYEEGETASPFGLKDQNANQPEAELVKKETVKELAEVIRTLSEKEQLVLSLFYHEECTLTEIGEILGLSTSRISQIHSKAIYKLRNTLGKKLLP
ncbi:RNA polymerase sigma-D factor [Weizmannia acidilactici]|uniref:RNA polymerase sigma-D factor n=1 Tax=Weizmannia acidilactici TaxID=2607726 RepID=A0A5J4J1S3_9BACI|nr:FliA/WhiG family RNA polymerase sigma factor [Weizmannia acidilactici]GER69022.1 RNA polymerase sigma-D factor [Weizmannia acidilactici]GER72005.1 RNA polymerase sigma-D factor [Weizmannia acidilactici]